MSLSTSSDMKLLFGLDESGATAIRANTGSKGTALDLIAVGDDDPTGAATEGLPTVADGNNGKAVDIRPAGPVAPWTGVLRALRTAALGTPDVAAAAGNIPAGHPMLSTSLEWAWGCRLKWSDPLTDLSAVGPNSLQIAFQLGRDADIEAASSWDNPQLMIGIVPDSDLNPTGARIYLQTPSTQEIYDDADHTATGSPSSYYIQPELWYRVLVRFFWDGGTGYDYKVYVYEESTSSTFTFLYIGAGALSDIGFSDPGRTYAWAIGYPNRSALEGFYGYVDECWWYDAAMTDQQALDLIIEGLSIPWEEPDRYREANEVHSALTKENADYPLMRPLPTGGTIVRHPVDVLAQEIRTRLEGWKAGQPWALRAVDYIFDPAGPYGSQRARKGERPDLSIGVWRSPGQKPWGAAEDSRNVEYTYAGPRRRRGFKIRRIVDSSAVNGHNAFWTWRSYDDELFRAYKVGTSIYRDSGGFATAIDTGWNPSQMPAAFFLDDRFVVLSPQTGILLDGTATVQNFGAAAPASLSAAAASGGTLDASYFYAATLYDPTHGDETGPVVSAVVSPANQKVTLTLPATAPDTRFTQYRIYRTNADGSVPNLFLIKTVTVAASVDDTGEVDGTQLLPQVTDSDGNFLDYITSAAPDTFALGVAHQERAIYAKGGTNPERVYIFEPNEPLRNYAAQWIAADGPVRALASWQGRLVIYTDNTVEIVESDFVRDDNGELNINRTVVSRSVGALGHNSVIVFQGQIFWLDRRGVFTLQGTEAIPVSDRIRDLFPHNNTNLGQQIVGGWNHLTRTLWWTLPNSSFQADAGQMQTQFVMPIDAPEKWWFHDIEATYVGQFDDDLNGQRFGSIDHAGIFKELESYEGDGQEGDEAGTFQDDGTDDFSGSPAGITSISAYTVAVEGSPGWTTNEHAGKGIILRDRSTRKLYYFTIRSNTAGGLTLSGLPVAALAAGDGYYIGGMNAFLQLAGYDFGSPNRKIVRQVQYTFADLTREELFL